MEAVRTIDPLSLHGPLLLARVYFYQRDYEKSLQFSRAMLPYDVRFALTHDSMGLAYEWKGDYPQAVTEFRQYEALSGGDPDAVLALAETYALMGDRRRALNLVDQLRNKQGTYVPTYGYAQVYAALGNKDEAYRWLEASAGQHAASCMLLLVDPVFRAYRGEARFQQLLRRTGHPVAAPEG